MARRCRARPTSAGWASASSGTWGGCTTRWSTCKLQPVHRRWHHDQMTFGMVYAFSENFVLPLSHDEVVHGKGSLLARVPGDAWQQFATLRAYYAFMWALPGQEAAVHGPGVRAGPRVELRRGPRLASARHRLAPRRAGAGARLQPPLPRAARRCTSATARRDGFRWIEVDDRGQLGLRLAPARRRRRAAGGRRSRTSRRCCGRATASACRCRAAGARSSTPTRQLYGGSNRGNAGGVDAHPGESHGYPNFGERSRCRRSPPSGWSTTGARRPQRDLPQCTPPGDECHGPGHLLDTAGTLGDGLRARRRPRQPADGAHRAARQARRLLRRQVADHRLRAVERAEFGHPPHRRRDAVQGAQPDPAPAARLELPAAGAQRELRHPAGEPARRRGPVVRRAPPTRCSRTSTSSTATRPSTWSSSPATTSTRWTTSGCSSSTSTTAPTSPSPASRCRSPRRAASASCTSTATTASSSFVEKPEHPPEMPDRPGWALASMGIYVFRREFLNEQLRRDAADPDSTPRLRPRHHSLPGAERQGGRPSLHRAPASGRATRPRSTGATSGRSTRTGRPTST